MGHCFFSFFFPLLYFPFAKIVTKAVCGLHRNSSGIPVSKIMSQLTLKCLYIRKSQIYK